MTLVLVTGASGFAGTHLTQHLDTHPGVHWVGFSRRHGDDIRDPEQVRNAVAQLNPDAIIHLAGQAYVPEATTNPRRGLEVNTLGTLNLLEAVRHTGSRARILLAGTSAEYGTPTGIITEQTPCAPDTAYGVTKLAATTLGMFYHTQYGIPVVVSRAFNHTGPRHQPVYAIPWFCKQIIEIERGEREILTHGDLAAVRSYADVRDIVHGYWALATTAPPGIYNIGADLFYTLGDILHQLIGMTDIDVYTGCDKTLYRDGARVGQKTPPMVSFDKIQNAVGWQQTYPLKTTLRHTLEYWRSLT